jgi:hypothetical protein
MTSTHHPHTKHHDANRQTHRPQQYGDRAEKAGGKREEQSDPYVLRWTLSSPEASIREISSKWHQEAQSATFQIETSINRDHGNREPRDHILQIRLPSSIPRNEKGENEKKTPQHAPSKQDSQSRAPLSPSRIPWGKKSMTGTCSSWTSQSELQVGNTWDGILHVCSRKS